MVSTVILVGKNTCFIDEPLLNLTFYLSKAVYISGFCASSIFSDPRSKSCSILLGESFFIFIYFRNLIFV